MKKIFLTLAIISLNFTSAQEVIRMTTTGCLLKSIEYASSYKKDTKNKELLKIDEYSILLVEKIGKNSFSFLYGNFIITAHNAVTDYPKGHTSLFNYKEIWSSNGYKIFISDKKENTYGGKDYYLWINGYQIYVSTQNEEIIFSLVNEKNAHIYAQKYLNL